MAAEYKYTIFTRHYETLPYMYCKAVNSYFFVLIMIDEFQRKNNEHSQPLFTIRQPPRRLLQCINFAPGPLSKWLPWQQSTIRFYYLTFKRLPLSINVTMQCCSRFGNFSVFINFFPSPVSMVTLVRGQRKVQGSSFFSCLWGKIRHAFFFFFQNLAGLLQQSSTFRSIAHISGFLPIPSSKIVLRLLRIIIT